MRNAKALFCLCLLASASLVSAQESQRQYLSGRDRDSSVKWEFLCTDGRNSGQWTTILVPSCWELQGFGNYAYFRDDQAKPAEKGQYRHSFAVPQDWSDKTVYLVFDGAMTDTEAKINGQPAGPVHQGGFYQFRYDVTSLLKPGSPDNLLEVTVSKKSANESINRAERQADYWLFGGIFRPVYLEAVPREHIQRVAISAQADGAFAIDAFTSPLTSTISLGLEVELLDAAGKSVALLSGSAGGMTTHLQGSVAGVSTWTAETPHLYTAQIRLKAGDRVIHQIQQRFGFRTIEVRKGDGIYVNGQRVILKGVCRHAFWPDSGRTLSPTLDRKDIELIKDMNMNAVRMSHYPPDISFLELCDELGLYVLDEMAGWQKSYDAETATRLVGETVTRDVNHPSILFWDNGNEGGWNTAADGEFAKWDPQHRAVLHPWALHDNINTKHYADYALHTKLLAGPDLYMPTEFLHGLYDGGLGAGMRDYWDAMRASKISAGGFFWVLADEGIVRTDRNGEIDVAGNSAPDGITGPYRQKEASFYTIQKLWSPVVLPDQLPSDFAGRLPVENTYSFTSLDRIRFQWQLRQWKGIDQTGDGYTLIAQGDAPSPNVAPSQKGTLTLPLPDGWRSADALALTATDWTNRLLCTWVWPLNRPTVPHPVAQTESAPATPGELTSGQVTLKFDPATGVLRSITRAGQILPLTNGPRLALGTPRTPGSTGSAGSAGTPSTQPSAKPTGRLTSATWTAAADGWFALDYTYEAQGPCEYLGITFDLPEKDVKSVRWLGAGPQRVWANRLDGPTLGVWEKQYNNTITGWTAWEYPEFKGYYADLHWAKLTTEQGAITLAAQTPGLYLHLLTPELPPANISKTVTVPFPDGTLSLLHAIPAIANKLCTIDKLGPQSQLTQATGTYHAVIWFRFQ